jgi:hypothetical protein
LSLQSTPDLELKIKQLENENFHTRRIKTGCSQRNGLIRWLRPDYQAPTQTANQTAIDGIDGIDGIDETAIAPPEQQKWPTQFKDQLAIVRDLLRTQGSEWTETQISAQFKGKKKPGEIAQTLDILESLGLIRHDDCDGQTRWYAAELQQTG